MLALLNFSILIQMLVLTIYLAFNISYVFIYFVSVEINRKNGTMIPYIFACSKQWVLVFLSSGTCRYYLQFVMIWSIRANLLKLMKTYTMYLVIQNLINKSSFRWILSCSRSLEFLNRQSRWILSSSRLNHQG